MSRKSDRKIIDDVRDYLRGHYYLIHKDQSCCDWVKHFNLYHKMSSRNEFENGEARIEQFLTYLAVSEQVVPSTHIIKS